MADLKISELTPASVVAGSDILPIVASGANLAATISQIASAVTNDIAFAEAVDARVAALLVAGTNITLAYNDGANTLTISSAVFSGGDTTAPVLSNPTDAANGQNGATLTVSTNEANGPLYFYISTSATPPSASDLITSTGDVVGGSQVVTATGVQTIDVATGLTASTAYFAHFLHRDAAGNNSAIVSGNGFTTDAAVAGGVGIFHQRGQSNADGSGGNTDATAIKNYGTAGTIPTLQVEKTSGSTVVTAVHSWVDYNIYDVGTGNLGGESDVQDGPTGLTSGVLAIVRESDVGNIFGSATELRIIKNAVAGQLLSTFEPLGQHWGWENAAINGLLRTWRDGLTEAPFMQAAAWFQGEADVNQAQLAGSTDVPLLNTYAARWEGMYDYLTEQYGPQPPWFLIQIAGLDTYCDYFNSTILEQICGTKITINSSGAIVGGIVDLANGKPTDRIIVAHPFDGDIHPSNAELQLIHGAIADALVLLHGGDGFTNDFPMSDLPPVWITAPTLSGSPTASAATFTGLVSDAATVHVAAVAANASAPSAAQIVAGTGGGILFAASDSFTINTTDTVQITGLTSGTEYDFYFVARADGVNSAVKSVEGVTTASASAAYFDTAFSATLVNYSTVTTTNDKVQRHSSGALGVRASGPIPATPSYIAVTVNDATPSFVGFYSSLTAGGGGNLATTGTRIGLVNTGTIRHPVSAGAETTGPSIGNPVATSLIENAIKPSTSEVWIRRNGGLWNNDALADPVTGIGGLSYAGLTGPLYFGAVLSSTIPSGLTIMTGASPLAGFTRLAA